MNYANSIVVTGSSSVVASGVLLVNALWFLAGFVQFTLKERSTVRMLVARPQRDDALVPTLAASVRFLGGMNLALAVLATICALSRSLFAGPADRAVLFAFFALVHATQFGCNVPVLRARRRAPNAYWPVLSGPMRFIFIVDGSLAVTDLVLAACANTHL